MVTVKFITKKPIFKENWILSFNVLLAASGMIELKLFEYRKIYIQKHMQQQIMN